MHTALGSAEHKNLLETNGGVSMYCTEDLSLRSQAHSGNEQAV